MHSMWEVLLTLCYYNKRFSENKNINQNRNFTILENLQEKEVRQIENKNRKCDVHYLTK